MRTTPLTAAVTAAFLVAGLTACAAAEPAAEPEVVVTPETDDATEAAHTWTEDEMTADLIEDFPDTDTAALTALSERLDAAAPSAVGVSVRVSIFEEGKVVLQIVVKDADSMISASELSAVLAEMKAFTGSPVTEWLIESKDMVDGAYVDLDTVAAEAGVPAEAIGNWGDITLTPELLASFA